MDQLAQKPSFAHSFHIILLLSRSRLHALRTRCSRRMAPFYRCSNCPAFSSGFLRVSSVKHLSRWKRLVRGNTAHSSRIYATKGKRIVKDVSVTSLTTAGNVFCIFLLPNFFFWKCKSLLCSNFSCSPLKDEWCFILFFLCVY